MPGSAGSDGGEGLGVLANQEIDLGAQGEDAAAGALAIGPVVQGDQGLIEHPAAEGGLGGGRVEGAAPVDAVGDEGAHAHAALGEELVEAHGLAQGGLLGCVDHGEGGGGVTEEATHALRALPEAGKHGLESLNEVEEISEECAPDEARDAAGDDTAHPEEAAAAGGAGGLEEEPHGVGVEEGLEAPRGFEEVDGVDGRRRVEDDEVVVPGVVEHDEVLHRHVLVGAREGGGGLGVKGVIEDALAVGGAGGVAADHLVEGGLGIEHLGVEGAANGGAEVDRHGVGGHGGHAEGVGQAARRVDGDHEGAPPLRGGTEGEGGAGGGLAHATATHADENPEIREEGVEGRAHASGSEGSRITGGALQRARRGPVLM